MLLFGQAMLNTRRACRVIGGAIGLLAGGLLAVLRTPRLVDVLPLRLLATLYVEMFRRIPFLVKLLCVFFGFQYLGIAGAAVRRRAGDRVAFRDRVRRRTGSRAACSPSTPTRSTRRRR